MFKTSTYLIFTFFLLACSSKEDVVPEVILSSENELLNFTIANLETEIKDDKILIYTNASALDFNFEPTYALSEFATITPEPTLTDYSEPVSFTVAAQNGVKKTYTTELVINEGLQEIKFIYEIESGFIGEHVGIINEENKKITLLTNKESVMLPNTTAMVEIKTVGDLQTNPTSGTMVDLDFNTLTIIKTDGVEEQYAIEFLNINRGIDCIKLNLLGEETCGIRLAFGISAFYEGLNSNDYIFPILETQDITNLFASTEFIPIGATIEPSLDTSIDFTEDVVFTVTSEAGDSSEITIRIVKTKVFFGLEFRRVSQTNDYNQTFNSRYYAISKIVKIDLYNAEQDKNFPCTIIENSFLPNQESSIAFNMNEVNEANKGLEFQVRVELENGDRILTEQRFLINL